MPRNPFFLPSGYEPQERINILEAKGDNKKRLEKIKGRKRVEQLRLNCIKAGRVLVAGMRFKKQKAPKPDQIQRGYDLALEWGWDGIDRPYVPVIISIFGGSKRKKA